MAALSPGTCIFGISFGDLHSTMLLIVGLRMLHSTMTQSVMIFRTDSDVLFPIRHAKSFWGFRSVPPKFLKLWSTLMFILALEAKRTVLVSADKIQTRSSSYLSCDQASAIIVVSMLPFSMSGNELNHCLQVG